MPKEEQMAAPATADVRSLEKLISRFVDRGHGIQIESAPETNGEKNMRVWCTGDGPRELMLECASAEFVDERPLAHELENRARLSIMPHAWFEAAFGSRAACSGGSAEAASE